MKTCLILAQVKSIYSSSIFYFFCSICLSKASNKQGEYLCNKCNHIIQNPSPRYKLSLEIFDGSALARVVVFGDALRKFIGKNAMQFLRWKKSCQFEYGISVEKLDKILAQYLKEYLVNEWFYFKFNFKNMHNLVYKQISSGNINTSSAKVVNLRSIKMLHDGVKSLTAVNLYKTAKHGSFTTIIQKINLILKKRKQKKLQTVKIESFYQNSINFVKKNRILNRKNSFYKFYLNSNKKRQIYSKSLDETLKSNLDRSSLKCVYEQKYNICNKISLFANDTLIDNSSHIKSKYKLINNYKEYYPALISCIDSSQSIVAKNILPECTTVNKYNFAENMIDNIFNRCLAENNYKKIDYIGGITSPEPLQSNVSSNSSKVPLNSNCTNSGVKASQLIKFQDHLEFKENISKDIFIDTNNSNMSQDLFSPFYSLMKRKKLVTSTPLLQNIKLPISFDDSYKAESPNILTNKILWANVHQDGCCIRNSPGNILPMKMDFINEGYYKSHCPISMSNIKVQNILSEEYFRNHSPMISSNNKCRSISKSLNQTRNIYNYSDLFTNESDKIFDKNYNLSNDLFE